MWTKKEEVRIILKKTFLTRIAFNKTTENRDHRKANKEHSPEKIIIWSIG